jgi:hypothetical protein
MTDYTIDYSKTDYASAFLRYALGRPEPDVDLGVAFYTDEEIAAYLAQIPSSADLQTAYEAANGRDGPAAKIRGVIWGVESAGSDLKYKSAAFRPDANGDCEFWCEPFFDADGVLRDLIWCDSDNFEWGFSTGHAHMFGAELLTSQEYTPENPLPVTDCPMVWADEGRKGVCLLKLSSRMDLRQAAFVRCDTFDMLGVIAAEAFEDDRDRVFGPADPAELQLWLEAVGREELAAAEWLESRRIARGGDPNEPLPVELMV